LARHCTNSSSSWKRVASLQPASASEARLPRAPPHQAPQPANSTQARHADAPRDLLRVHDGVRSAVRGL
jgi:hypothetical protein